MPDIFLLVLQKLYILTRSFATRLNVTFSVPHDEVSPIDVGKENLSYLLVYSCIV